MLSINQHPHNAKFRFENPVIFSIRICKSGVLCKGKIFSPCRFSIRFKLVTQIWYVNQQKAACVVSAVWCIATLLTMDNESFFNCKISLMWPRHYNIFKNAFNSPLYFLSPTSTICSVLFAPIAHTLLWQFPFTTDLLVWALWNPTSHHSL